MHQIGIPKGEALGWGCSRLLPHAAQANCSAAPYMGNGERGGQLSALVNGCFWRMIASSRW